jgi:hypothetical protein
MVQGRTKVKDDILCAKMHRAKTYPASKILGDMPSSVEQRRDQGKDPLLALSNMGAMMPQTVQ